MQNSIIRVLSLDGGGAKGFYTLGVLREVEAMMGGGPLSDHFRLIFGTSTGSIIGALLALGYKVNDIYELYREHVPRITKPKGRGRKSQALASLAHDVFKEQKFDAFKTGIGIVSTKWMIERPMIFKANIDQAHGRKASFVPGFGCTIGEAVEASCSAYPFFNRKVVVTAAGDRVDLVDGGYCANNPTLYAMADALVALQVLTRNCGCSVSALGRTPHRRRRYLAKCGGQNIWRACSSCRKPWKSTLSRWTSSGSYFSGTSILSASTIRSSSLRWRLICSSMTWTSSTCCASAGSNRSQSTRRLCGSNFFSGMTMAIAESQLDTWAKQGPTKQFTDTYASIKTVLEDKNAPYAARSMDPVYLQGSYGNDTNVYADSDVDLVICSDASFNYDISRLSDAEKAAFQRDHPSTGLSTQSFQQDVYAWLKQKYTSDVDPPKKAVHIEATSYRRAADVLICIEHRQYHGYTSLTVNRHYKGVQFNAADGTSIVNFPKEHSKACTTKHQTTNMWFKPTVRILKNMRNRMIEKSIIKDGLASSYYIEGMLWNVPNDTFGGTFVSTVAGCLNWLNAADKDKLLCAHQLQWLLRDGKPDCWPPVSFSTYLAESIKFWNAGG